MTKTFLTATGLTLTLAATGAPAEQHVGADMATEAGTEMEAGTDMMAMQGSLIRTRDIVDGTIYTINEADDEGWEAGTMYDTVGADWNQIGEIEDLVLSQEGQLIGIVAEIGGFLDIADKHVMIPVADVNLVAVDDVNYAYVTRMSEEDLEAMQGVDEGFWD